MSTPAASDATTAASSGYRPIADQLADAIAAAVAVFASEQGLDFEVAAESVHLERPASREHGDWSTNVALVTAKKASTNPRALATSIVEVLERALPDNVVAVEVAGPGW